MVGASEGGIITTLLAERFPQQISGDLAACGPAGDFHLPIGYVGNSRVLLDYFFPGLLPGSPIQVPNELIASWGSIYAFAVRAALAANPDAAHQLIATARGPVTPADPTALETTVINVLWY